MRGWFEEGAARIARNERERGVGGVVHGDFKLDNMVRPVNPVQSFYLSRSSRARRMTSGRSSTPHSLGSLVYWTGN